MHKNPPAFLCLCLLVSSGKRWFCFTSLESPWLLFINILQIFHLQHTSLSFIAIHHLFGIGSVGCGCGMCQLQITFIRVVCVFHDFSGAKAVCNFRIQWKLKGWVCTHWLSITNILLRKYSKRSLGLKFLATCAAEYTLRTAAQEGLTNCCGWCLQSRGEVGYGEAYDNLTCAWASPTHFQILLWGHVSRWYTAPHSTLTLCCPVGALPINMSLANGGLVTEVKGSMNKRVKVINETKTGCSSGERFESQTFRVFGLWIQKTLSGVLPALCESDRSHTGSAWAFGQSWSKAVEHSFCG